MKKILLLSILISISILPSITFAQSLQFTLTSKTTEYHADKIGESSKIKIRIKDEIFNVILEPSKFSVKNGDYEKIYDFTSDKLILINHTDKTFIETSLYAIPAFKDFERKNRMRLYQSIQAVKIGALKADPYYLDVLFGDDPSSKTGNMLSMTSQNGETKYSYDGDEVTSYSLSEQKLLEELEDSYKKFLVYELSIHPMIWNELSQKRVLFSSLSYKIKQEVPVIIERNVSTSNFIKNAVEAIKVPNSYTKNYATDAKLNHVIKLSMTQKEETVDGYFKEMKKQLDKKNYLEATLIFYAYATQTGGKDDDAHKDIEAHKSITQRIFSEAPKNSGVLDLSIAIRQQPKTKEQLQSVIQIIEEARKKGNTHSYILNVFLANYLSMAGKTKEAQSLILQALEKNPFMAGAYKDLGDKYFRGFDMMNAWASWDQMRKLNPDHQLALPIQRFEQQIRQKHPVYFQ